MHRRRAHLGKGGTLAGVTARPYRSPRVTTAPSRVRQRRAPWLLPISLPVTLSASSTTRCGSGRRKHYITNSASLEDVRATF